MSDFKEVVQRLVTDAAFRSDLLSDVEGTLKAHGLGVTASELGELKSLNESHLDELDERFSNRLYSTRGTSIGRLPQLASTVNLLGSQGLFSLGGRAGGMRVAGGLPGGFGGGPGGMGGGGVFSGWG